MATTLVRNVTVYRASGTTAMTATFAESTALDSTYLLVAAVQVASSTALSAPSGWTELSGGGNNGSNQVRTYVKQGDGSTNSFAITPASGSATVVLMAFSGYTSLTPIAASGSTGTATTSRAITFAASSGTYGIALSIIGVVGTVTWGTVTNGTRVGASTGSTSVVNASQLLSVARAEYSGSSFSATQAWTTSRTQYYMNVVLPLVYTPPAAHMAFSLDEGSGGTLHDSSGNAYDFTLSDTTRWSTSGKTNGGLGYGAGSAYAMRTLTSDIANGGAFTVMMWVNPANTTQSAAGLIGNTALDLEFDSGHFYGDGFGSTSASYAASTWTHVAWVADGTTKTIYANGSSALTASGAAPTGWANGNAIGIGGTDDTSVFNGIIDDIRVFKSALSPADISYFMSTPVASVSSAPSITTPALNDMAIGNAFSQTLTASGATPITWSVTTGSAPAGLSLSSSGVLSGTPTTPGSYDFVVTATNSAGSATKEFTGSVTSTTLPSPIAEYGFNEGTGTSSADLTGNGNTLTITSGQATWTASGKNSNGLTGNSGTGAVNTSFSNPTTNTTIMGWVNPSSVSGGEYALFGFWSSPSSDPNGTTQFALYASRSGFGTSNHLVGNFRVGGTLTEIVGPTLISGTWTHVALSYDGSSAKLYLNGSLYTTVAASGSLSTGYFAAAARTNATVDDVRVFNQALSQSQISAYMYTAAGGAANDYVDHTIFAGTTPSGISLGSYSDAGSGAWIGTQFYITASPARSWKLVGVRIYVPSGSSLIGLTGYIGVQRRDAAGGSVFGGSGSSDEGNYPNNWETNGAKTPMWRSLVAGWNDFYLSRTWDANSLDGLMLGYSIGGGGYYVFDSGLTTDPVKSIDGTNLYLSEYDGGGGGGAARSFYAPVGALSSRTTAHWYGIDIIARETTAPPPAPIAAYNFDEGIGTAARDWSGNNFTATVEGAWTTGMTNGGLSASSTSEAASVGVTSSYAILPTQTAPEISFMAWTKPISLNGNLAYAAYDYPGGNTQVFGITLNSGGTVTAKVKNGTYGTVTSVATLAIGTWTHIAVVIDAASSSIKLYLNGSLDSTGTLTSAITLGNITQLRLGGYNGGSAYNMAVIDDVRLFNAALTDSQVSSFVSSPVSGSGPLWLTKSASGLVTVSPYLLGGSGLASIGPGYVKP